MEARDVYELSGETESTRGAALNGPGSTIGSAIFRAAAFLGFWLVLTDANRGDLVAGLLAAVTATWASLRLMPPEQWSLHPIRLAGTRTALFRQSIAAGTDVAWRALDPRLPIRPGFVVYRARLPPGTKRNAFCAIIKDGGMAKSR